MTNDPTTNRKSTRQDTRRPSTDPLVHVKPTRADLHTASNSPGTNNLMRFVENRPTHASDRPHPRSGHRAIATESDLWMWGGYYPATDSQPERMFEEVSWSAVTQRSRSCCSRSSFSFGVTISHCDAGRWSPRRAMALFKRLPHTRVCSCRRSNRESHRHSFSVPIS